MAHVHSLPIKCVDTRAIFSLTTLPSRAEKIYPTVYSLLDQNVPLKIEIHIPLKANPEPLMEYKFPESITSHPNIKIIQHPHDYGPSMKFIPAILSENECSIISVDDDMIYPRELSEKLIKAVEQNGENIYCARGNVFEGKISYNTSPTYHSVDVLENKQVAIITGCGGYIIPPSVSQKLKGCIADYSNAPKECRTMDDVWISGLASREGISKYVIPEISKYSISIGSFFTNAYLNNDREKANESAIQYFSWNKGEVVVSPPS